jgi:MFS transporter, FHS family, glucose/mannose:H+ symporter
MYSHNRVFAAACIGLFLFGMTLITLGSILPALEIKFLETGANAGILTSILPIGILTGSLLFGPIVDRYGYQLLLIASVIVSALAIEGLAFFDSVTAICLCIFFIGVAGGILNGGGSALVSDISSENKGANLSLLGVFYGIGAVGMPLLLGILSKRFDYQSILSAVGVFFLLLVFYFIVTKFPTPKQAQGFPLKEGVKLLKQPALLLASFFLFFQSGVELLISNWTTTFLQDHLLATPEDALYALSFFVGGLTVARLLLGALLKKISSFLILLFSLLLVAGACLLLYYTRDYNIAFAALIITGAGLAAGFPVILGYIGQLYASLSGTAFSIAFVTALTGSTIINYLFGFIKKKYSIGALPLLIVVFIACMIVLAVLLKQRIRGKVKF